MAGSYNCILSGWSMIENMGDAYEAMEQLMWLVQSQIGTEKAQDLLNKQYYPMCRGEREEDEHFQMVKNLMKA